MSKNLDQNNDTRLLKYYDIIMNMPNSNERKLAAEKYNYIMDNKNNMNAIQETNEINKLATMINVDIPKYEETNQKLKQIFDKYLNVNKYSQEDDDDKIYNRFKNFITYNWNNANYYRITDILVEGNFLPPFLSKNDDYVDAVIGVAARGLEDELIEVLGPRGF